MDGDATSPASEPADESVDGGVSPLAADALAAIETALGVLAGLDRTLLDGAQAAVITRRLAAATSRAGAISACLLPVVEADGLWAVGGARSFARWVAEHHQVPVRTAREQVRLGRTLRDHLPATAAAALAGDITVEQAQVIAGLGPTTDQRREVLADPEHECNEAFLVEQARTLPVDDLRTMARQWAAAADPDADDRGYVESCDREFLQVDRLGDMYHVAGQLTVPHGQTLTTALEAVTPVPAAGDDRTAGQRRGLALAALAQVVLDHGLAGSGRAVRPQVTVLVSEPRFRALVDAALAREAARAAVRGTQGSLTDDVPTRTPSVVTAAMLTGSGAELVPQYADGTSVPRPVLDKLACDGGLNRVIFGARSQVLDVGRTERLFTGPRRTAVIARDKHCRYPGCTAPPVLCECHHIEHWARDHGSTSVDNGILLCFHHHELVHDRDIEICRDHGLFVLLDSHGIRIDPDRDRRVGRVARRE